MRMIVERARSVFQGVMGICLIAGVLTGCGQGNGPVVEPPLPNGAITGQVVGGANNAPLAGAAVRTSAGAVTTGSDGKFSVPAPAGDRTLVQIEADDFADAFRVTRVRSGQTTVLGITLVPVSISATVGVASGGTVADPNSTARVVIPADGLVPQGGKAAAGDVTVKLARIDPGKDPNLMPGDFRGVSVGGGDATPIESFGAVLLDIRDSAGTRYDFAPGKPATIRIPVGSLSVNPPDTIPLWYFDETAGVWKEQGTASRQGTGASAFYEGPVTRSRYWNADQRMDTVFVSGCVRDTSNQPVADAMVQAKSSDYIGTSSAITSADGTFRIAIRKDSNVSLGVYEYNPQTFAFTAVSKLEPVKPSALDVTLANCLIKGTSLLKVTTDTLPNGQVGLDYNQTLTASGGVPGYAWSLDAKSNPLPNGLSLNSTGLLTGVPTTIGTTVLTVKVTDAVSGTATKPLILTILPKDPPLAITTASPLLDGIVGSSYSARITASGGTGARSWSVVGGALPLGLNLETSTGIISGIPTTAGPSTVTIRVQDSGSHQQSVQKAFDLTVKVISTLTITTPSPLPSGTVGTLYSTTVAAAGGTGTLSWSVVGGALPTALTLNASTGVISGTPTAAGTSTVTIRVHDSGSPQQSDQKVFDLTVGVTPPPPPGCVTGVTNCLTVLNAPTSVGGTFTGTISKQGSTEVNWKETSANGVIHDEDFTLAVHNLPGLTYQLVFVLAGFSGANFESEGWTCVLPDQLPPFETCSGVTIDRASGTLTLRNTIMGTINDTTQPITVNGILRFTPF